VSHGSSPGYDVRASRGVTESSAHAGNARPVRECHTPPELTGAGACVARGSTVPVVLVEPFALGALVHVDEFPGAVGAWNIWSRILSVGAGPVGAFLRSIPPC
jgi:hypothetical protein